MSEPPEQEKDSAASSMFDDVSTLIDDGRTLVEAELAYQKTRLAYAGRRGKNVAIFGLLAVVLAIFALFGLVIGLIWALTPLLTAWGATATVVLGTLLVAALCGIGALHNARLIGKAFKDNE